MTVYIFMLLVLSLSGLTIAYLNSILQGHYTEPGVIINSIFVLIYSVPQTSNRK